jgi:hypothetical protein
MVDAAFSCRAISGSLGAPLDAATTGWTTAATAVTPPARPARYRLTRGHRVDADLLWTFEQQLLAYLGDDSRTLLDRIRCLLEYLELAMTGDPTTPAAAILREVMGKAIPGQIANKAPPTAELDKTQRAVFLLWTFLVLNPAPIDILEWPRRRQQREGERRAAVADGFRRGHGRPLIDNRELDLSFDAVDSVTTDYLRRDGEPILASFLSAKLIGQRFRFADDDELPAVDAVKRLLLSYPIAIWAAKALAAERGATAVAEVDVRAALRFIDRSFDQIRTSALALEQRKAWDFIVGETDLVVVASLTLLRR